MDPKMPDSKVEVKEYEERLDQLFYEAFDANHPAMHDYALLKMELKRLRAVPIANNGVSLSIQDIEYICRHEVRVNPADWCKSAAIAIHARINHAK